MYSLLYKLIIAVSIFLILSLGLIFWHDGLPLGHDIYAHGTYAKLFNQALLEGQFPVRWTGWIKEGYNQPLFNFYQVGFYYLVSFVHLFVPSFILAIKLSVLFLWWLGAFFVYLLCQRFGKLPGILAALVFSFSPYLILDIFVRAAYPEFMAICFMPGILWAIDRLVTLKKQIYILPLATFLGIAIFSHLPTLLIFSPILLIFSLVIWGLEGRKLKTFGYLLFGAILGFGVSAFYLIPAIGELDLVNIQQLTSGYFDFHKHFSSTDIIYTYLWGYNESWMIDNIHLSLDLGLIQWAIPIGAFFSLLFIKSMRLRVIIIFWLLVLIYVLFFISLNSTIVWEKIKQLSFIQFPWRFFMVVPIATAVLGALAFSVFRSKYEQIGLLFIVILLIAFVHRPFLTPKNFIDAAYFDLPFSSFTQHKVVQREAYFEPGYNPIEVSENNIETDSKWFLEKNTAKVIEKKILSHLFVFDISSLEEDKLTINTHYFPGWKAYLDDVEVPIQRLDKHYFMTIDVPEGRHELIVKFEDTNTRKIANIITLVSLITLGALSMKRIMRRGFVETL